MGAEYRPVLRDSRGPSGYTKLVCQVNWGAEDNGPAVDAHTASHRL